MVRGIDSFREWFQGYEDHYAIIGGTACDLLMTDEGLDFRATKDIDLVLIVEAVQFYRFTNPHTKDYPAMIELFARKPDSIVLPDTAELTPLPIDEEISSLSAILLNDDYYEFLKRGRVHVTDVTVLDALHLIPFKAKAWLDLSDRKAAGEQVDSKNIRKHKNDIFRLSELLSRDQEPLDSLPDTIRNDMNLFFGRIESEDVDLKQLGIRGKTKDAIVGQLRNIYG